MLKRSAIFLLATAATWSGACLAQEESSKSARPDPYEATLNHLLSLTREEITDWHAHSDIPHPEDPSLNDSGWETVTVGSGHLWMGTRVFRRWIEVPEKINGYGTEGSRVSLDLRFVSRGILLPET